MTRFLIFLISVVSAGLCAQAEPGRGAADHKYLEDQFYVGVTYNILLHKPREVDQRNLSYGIMAGFVKDIPFNARRNVGIGIGLGYAVNAYYTNLLVTRAGNEFVYTPLKEDIPYKRNKIETHLIEVPLEFRWRNSTATDYKFWRIYTGIKLGYVAGSRSKFINEAGKLSFYNTDTDNFRYGLLLNVGYNTFNIHAYYALNELFDAGTVTTAGEPVGFIPLRIGIIFYIL